MIVVTRLNDSHFAVNPDLIERIHANPDTTLVMVDGATYIVTETLAEVIEMIVSYRAQVIARARELPSGARGTGPLGLVPSSGPSDEPSSEAASTVPLRPRSK